MMKLNPLHGGYWSVTAELRRGERCLSSGQSKGVISRWCKEGRDFRSVGNSITSIMIPRRSALIPSVPPDPNPNRNLAYNKYMNTSPGWGKGKWDRNCHPKMRWHTSAWPHTHSWPILGLGRSWLRNSWLGHSWLANLGLVTLGLGTLHGENQIKSALSSSVIWNLPQTQKN